MAFIGRGVYTDYWLVSGCCVVSLVWVTYERLEYQKEGNGGDWRLRLFVYGRSHDFSIHGVSYGRLENCYTGFEVLEVLEGFDMARSRWISCPNVNSLGPGCDRGVGGVLWLKPLI